MPKDYQEVENLVTYIDERIITLSNMTVGARRDVLRTTLTTYGNARVEEILKDPAVDYISREANEWVAHKSGLMGRPGKTWRAASFADLIEAIKK